MAETTKTYSLICPAPDCFTEFEVDLTPADVADGAECIQCPECDQEWEWDYDDATDTLTLIGEDVRDGT